MSVKILMCSTAVPWPDKPLLGIFHVHQAKALRSHGAEMQLFSPAPAIPRALGKVWSRVRAHTQRPARYDVDTVTIHAPRVPFVFPPVMRHTVAPKAPWLVDGAAKLTIGPSLRRLVREWKPDLLLGHGAVPWAGLLHETAKRFGIEWATIEHSAQDVMRLQNGSPLARHYLEQATRAKNVFVVGPQMEDYARDELGWPRVELLPNGATLPEDEIPTRPSEFDNRVVIVAAANYYRRKGFEELVEAIEPVLQSRPEVQLHLITAPPPELREKTRALEDSGSIVWHDPMPPEELLQWMNCADLFVLPSWAEAFGLVYVEALAQDTPVLATSDSGFALFAEKYTKDTGAQVAEVVPPKDVPALRSALETLTSDAALRASIAEAGHKMVDEWFRWERNAELLLRGTGLPVAESDAPQTRAGDVSGRRSAHGQEAVDPELSPGGR